MEEMLPDSNGNDKYIKDDWQQQLCCQDEGQQVYKHISMSGQLKEDPAREIFR